jgi:membrane-associated protease RseP (regulator of RpoE activity)
VRGSLAESAAVWRFGTWPKVYSVDLGGPAARAGLRRGDVITRIDGVSILTPEGGRRFGAIRPGQTVRWTVRREGALHFVVARAAERPERRERVALTELANLNQRIERVVLTELRSELSRLNEMSNLGQLRRELANLNQRIERVKLESLERTRLQDLERVRVIELPVRRLRYAGVIGGTEVEVRGPGSVIVIESDHRDELVINTGEAVVVIRVPGVVPKKAGDRKK